MGFSAFGHLVRGHLDYANRSRERRYGPRSLALGAPFEAGVPGRSCVGINLLRKIHEDCSEVVLPRWHRLSSFLASLSISRSRATFDDRRKRAERLKQVGSSHPPPLPVRISPTLCRQKR